MTNKGNDSTQPDNVKSNQDPAPLNQTPPADPEETTSLRFDDGKKNIIEFESDSKAQD